MYINVLEFGPGAKSRNLRREVFNSLQFTSNGVLGKFIDSAVFHKPDVSWV